MSIPSIHIAMREWQTLNPSNRPELRSFRLEDAASRALAKDISRSGMLEIVELHEGLQIRASSFVGRLRLGNLTVSVLPKLNGMPLFILLRYAYHFRDLQTVPKADFVTSHTGLLDLLIFQLLAEAKELLSKGLHRKYTRRDSALSSPKGKLNMNRIATQNIITALRLPCIYHPRLSDCLPNQVLLAGLDFAARLSQSNLLRTNCRRIAEIIREDVSTVSLNSALLRELNINLDRLTSAYKPSARIIHLLYSGHGVTLDDENRAIQVQGFLLDMNRFFQALLSRFLNEYLINYSILDEYRLKGMMVYLPGYNPLNKQPPTPRPDYIIQKKARIISVLDAKYRDLWEDSLPSEMLYQLAIYALSQKGLRKASILYPTLNREAQEARVGIKDPSTGQQLGVVILRPVDLMTLEYLLRLPRSPQNDRARKDYAEKLAFGDFGTPLKL
jgi:5-methylcytosine-specific restriction enzyme subunit McrC